MKIKNSLGKLVALAFLQMAISMSAQTVKTTWLGNSFGYANGNWVQNHINSLYVAPDGKCFTTSIWDEGHHEKGIYKDGEMLGNLEGIAGGLAITGDGTYVYVADGDATCYKIKRFNVSDGGYAGLDILMPANTKVYDLAAKNGKLYASDPNNNRILIYNLTDGSSSGSFSVTRPADIAVDNNGNVWVVQSSYSFGGRIPSVNSYIAAPKILCYSGTGTKQSREITDVIDPTDLAIDNNGRLLVTDNSSNLQIRCYTNLNGTPSLDNTFFNGGKFGQQGGVYAGTRGLNAPDKFYKLANVGVDGAGNIYVNLGGPSPKGDNPLMDVDLRKFNTSGQLQWQLLGKEFVDMGDLDPADDTKFYTKDSKYSLDWSKTVAGSEWNYNSYTIDPYRYPKDPRVKPAGSPTIYQSIENVFTRRINGQLFLFANSMAGDQGHMWVFRFKSTTDGEIAIPAACLGTHKPADTWPAELPANSSDYEFLWRDLNGNGQWDANEHTINPIREYPYANGLWPDENGNLWRAYRDVGIRKLICSGVDANGVPIYNFTNRIFYSKPDPLTDAHFIRYFPTTDEMFVAGWTTSNPSSGGDHPGQIHSIVKYSNWSSTRVKVWESPSSLYTELNTAESFDIAGDYIFTVYKGRDGATVPPWNGTVYVYKKSDGTKVTSFSPGAEVGSACGWVDIWDGGIRAHKRANGEYAIFIEDDAHNKTIIYRWNPVGTSVAVTGVSVSPASVSIVASATSQLTATIAPSNATNKSVTWSTSNSTVATVSATGLVTGKAAGNATITVTTANGSKTATCAVTVTSSGGGASSHTIRLEVIAGWNYVQFFKYFDGNNWITVDYNSPSINHNFLVHSAGWLESETTGNYAELTFTGTGVELYGDKTSYGGTGKIFIDGVYQQDVSYYNASSQGDVLLFSISGLSTGTSSTHVYDFNGINAANTDYEVFLCDVDVFPFAGSTANRNTMVDATDAQFSNIRAIDVNELLTVNPGSGDEMFVWVEMKITEAVSSISQIDFTYNGYTNGATSTHKIYVLKAGQAWQTSASWVQVGANQSITASNTTMTRSITSNIADYVDAYGNITFGIYETTSNQMEHVNYIGMTVKYSTLKSAKNEETVTAIEMDKLTNQPNVDVYPNPATNFVTVNLQNALNIGLARIQITDLVGKQVYSSVINETSTLQIGTSDFAKGIYIIAITQGAEKYNKKLIIE